MLQYSRMQSNFYEWSNVWKGIDFYISQTVVSLYVTVLEETRYVTKMNESTGLHDVTISSVHHLFTFIRYQMKCLHLRLL